MLAAPVLAADLPQALYAAPVLPAAAKASPTTAQAPALAVIQDAGAGAAEKSDALDALFENSSISNVYGAGVLSGERSIHTSIAPHHVGQRDIRVLNPSGRSLTGALRRLWLDRGPNKLAVTADPGRHRSRFSGVVRAGSSREVQWAVGPLSLTHGGGVIRKTSPYTGLQLSLALDGGARARTSVVFYARRGAERLRFVGSFPSAPVTKILDKGEAPSYAIDFEDMILEGDPERRSLAYLLLNVEIDAVGLAFGAGKEDLKVEGAVFGEMYFLSDLAKAPASFARYLERLAPNTLVEELMEDLPFLSSRKLHDMLRAMAIPGTEETTAGAPWGPNDLGAGHLGVEKLIIANKARLLSLDRGRLLSFFEERPALAIQRPNYPAAPGASQFNLDYFDPPRGFMSAWTARLYDPARQEHTLRVLHEQGIRAIYRTLEPDFKRVRLDLVDFSVLWQHVAPYEGSGTPRVLFHLPIDRGAFGEDHLPFAHALALHTIMYDMSPRERAEFILPAFRHMQKSLGAFTYLWTLLTEASGSATPNSPRFWRDRVRSWTEANGPVR